MELATDAAAPADAGREPTSDEIGSLMDDLGVAPEANLIGVLQEVQDRLEYLPPPALAEIGRRMKVPLSRVYGVVTFYAQFHTEPRGRHTIRCCRGTACHVKGAERIVETVGRELGIEEEQTTPDRLFYLETVACVGACFLAPVIMIDDQYYGNLKPDGIGKILDSYRTGK